MRNIVYHGSRTFNIEVLRPRQAFNGESPHGKPAVFAANDVDFAVFMAVVGSRKMGGWDARRFAGRGFFVGAASLECLLDTGARGCVYELDSANFEGAAVEVKSFEPVQTLGSYAVTALNLPNDLTILSPQEEVEYYDSFMLVAAKS